MRDRKPAWPPAARMMRACVLGACGLALLSAGPAQAGGRAASAEPRAASPEAPAEVPTPHQVLRAIYAPDGRDTRLVFRTPDRFEDPEGGNSRVFWHGERLAFGGRTYFTGFVYHTPSTRAGEAVDGFDAPGLAQATFVQGPGGWTRLESDGFIGEVSLRLNRPVAIDEGRPTLRHPTRDGRLILAVPTRDFVNGFALRSFALLVFDPRGVDRMRNGSWTSLGILPAGEDNGAMCEPGPGRAGAMPCMAWTGTPEFLERGSGLPDVRIVPSGTAIAAPGRIRVLGGADAVTYRLDPLDRSYRPVEAPAARVPAP